MAEITEVKDGVLRITKTPAPTIETFDKNEVINKRAEAQTKVDHLILDAAKLQLDIATAQAEVAKLDVYLVDINKVVVPISK